MTVERLTSTAPSDCEPCQQTLASEETETEETAPEETAPERLRWAGVICVENEMTGDGRIIEEGALRWEEEEPGPIRLVIEDSGAHDGAVTVGRVLSIERREGGVIWGEGDFDAGSQYGSEALRLVGEKVQNGVSVDLDDVSFKIEVASEIMDEMDSLMEGDGEEGDGEAQVRQTSEDGERVVVAEINSDDEVMVTTAARIRAITLVGIPAFARAKIDLVDAEEESESLVASGEFRRPPAAWFDNPNLTEPTPLTITEDGRVFGHVAAWGTCHISHLHVGCITPPHSKTGYAQFMQGSIVTEEGKTLPIGKITLGSGHAGEKLSASAAVKHYDNTGTTAAYVAAGEDSHGIWIAGSIRFGLPEHKIEELRASPLSGDWREHNGNLEMVHALAVNVNGFPIPRPSGMVASGNVVSLVASGMVASEALVEKSTLDLDYLQRLIDREKRAEAQGLSRRVKESTLALKAKKIKEMSH